MKRSSACLSAGQAVSSAYKNQKNRRRKKEMKRGTIQLLTGFFLLLLPAVIFAYPLPGDEAPVEDRFGIYYDPELKPFYHGVASGDPLSDRVIIWTRVTPDHDMPIDAPIDVRWQVATDPFMTNVVKSGSFTTDSSRDYTVKVDVTGLEPDTVYYYCFSVPGANSVVGRTKTLPTGDVDRVRLAVLTGSNYQWGYFSGYAALAERNDIDAVIHTGDYIYEYPSGVYGHPDLENRDHFPDRELITIEDYRERYSQYRLDPDLRRLHQQFPMIAQWDDHEHANDCWKDGAENHDPATEGDWQQRVEASVQAYYEWMPIRKFDPSDFNIYRSFSFGNLLDLFVTESRIVGRDEPIAAKGNTGTIDENELYDPSRTMLGQDQFNWLVTGLTNSSATWKIISTSVMMSQIFLHDQYGNMDSWDGYPVERERIYGAVTQAGVTNFGTISGDFHTSFASELVPMSAYMDYISSGQGEVGFEFTTPSITSANFNELTSFTLPDGTVISPLAMRLPERHPITLQVEQAAMNANRHMKYMNIDQHGYMLVDFTPDRAQAEWYYVNSLLSPGAEANFAAAWYVNSGSPELHQASAPLQEPEKEMLPAPVEPLPSSIHLSVMGSYATGIFDESAAEIVAHDPEGQKLFVTNSNDNCIDILDINDPANIIKIGSVDLSQYGAGPNSVAVKNGIVAVAVQSDPKQAPGKVVFFTTDGQYLNQVQVGALPDMLTFTPDGKKVLVANEGEPNDDYTVDPEGSVSIIDIRRGVDRPRVYTAGFSQFNNCADELRSQGVRIFGPGATVAQDLEPEYIAVSPDSRTAWITLQENNAVALLDLRTNKISKIMPLGYKDHSVEGNGLDGSDKDKEIHIKTWPNLFGIYQPDSVAAFIINGTRYIITANEGDSRDYDGFSEESRVSKLDLDPERFPNADELQDKKQLGRLQVTTTMGDIDGDGDFDELYAFGARSFSVWKQEGDHLVQVYDSGDMIERITAAVYPDQFNCNNDDNDSMDKRSDNKGPEPEAIAHGIIRGHHFAFVGLERIGGIMVFDITDPADPVFVQYINNRNFAGDPEEGTAGDLAPEGIVFIPAMESPTGEPMLAVANEVSGTTTLFHIDISNLPVPRRGDLNNDGVVNRADLQVIRTYLRHPASVFPECDMDGDGRITIKDARKLVLIMDR